jgi:hypothetical protein
MKSDCSYSLPLTIEMQSIVKSPDSNSLTFTMKIGPNLASLSLLNFS